MSQFYPTTANPTLDRLMGFVAAEEDRSVADRGPAVHPLSRRRAGVAAGPRRVGPLVPDSRAIRVSRWSPWTKSRPNCQHAEQHPFYLATLISILIELGEFDRADQCFQQVARAASRLRILGGAGPSAARGPRRLCGRHPSL